MKILITGANGYIGLRLLSALSSTEHEVVAVVRNKDRLDQKTLEMFGERLEIVEHDFLSESSDATCPPDIDAAYYLIHSMGSGPGFAAREEQCAEQFIQWLAPTSCRQIIYLSGIIPDSGKLSTHLESRQRVADLLSQSSIALTTLRASIIVGSGSASFEIIRDLVEKLPVMITPRWTRTRCQPIAIRNVIAYLTGVLANEKCLNQSFDIGGPDQLSYRDMMKLYADTRGLVRLIIPAPLFSPRLSSYWLSLVTATNYQLAKALVGSLHMETVCREHQIQEIIPQELLSYQQAIELAFSRIAQNRVPSTWYGAMSTGKLRPDQIRNIQVPEYGILGDSQSVPLTSSRNDAVDAVWSIGGKRGWPSMTWAWKLRGLMDKMIGGIGMRRGRRSATELKPGDALDFWRVVVADRDAGRLMLYAEMRLPGEAWLEFQVDGQTLKQTATFRPLGLIGRAYWYATFPLHLILFPRMARQLASGWKPHDPAS
ncbi:SDR family oxidoreductase [Verrucomicrobiaceae bacterium R5-34]|nr:SDR family oxidoreductase [Verrucomicrobiaceae bacterium R5-34]